MAARSRAVSFFAIAALLATAVAALAFLPASGAAGSGAAERRPDLVQRTPRNVSAASEGSGFALGFDAAVENHGEGPLLVRGSRTSAEPDMTADQLVRRGDGSEKRVRGIGLLRYTYSGGHDHWHYLRAVRYELRRVSDHVLVRPDQKTGFCLGDRYDTGKNFRHKPRSARLTGYCRPNEPEARSVDMGISVGYGDDYDAYLEGQSIDLTGVPQGRYELVHRANPRRGLLETRYDNNASSVLIDLRWPRGQDERPSVEVLARCPGRERCTG